MMEAGTVRKYMNESGKEGKPFLFGVDFELELGFFVEFPLESGDIQFAFGPVTNMHLPSGVCPVPEFEVFPVREEEYTRKFDIVRNGLLRGDTFLLNLTERTKIRTNLTLMQIFQYGKARYKVLMPERFVCFSPECFVRIEDNRIFTYPMKGTIDASISDAERLLLEDYKEICEHYTIVDLLRNDLNMVAEDVKVNRFRYMERVQTLRGDILQTSSEISGRLPEDWRSGVGDLIFRLLPAGSISGAPKPSTLRIIRSAEGRPRGYYSGVCGYFDGNGLDSAVMIRFIEKDGDELYFRSGGGITINSDAVAEYKEVLEKVYLPF